MEAIIWGVLPLERDEVLKVKELMNKLLFVLILFLTTVVSFAQQGLGYYYDSYNRFYVFEKGQSIQVESYRVDSIHAGNNCLAYINNLGNLKIYYAGKTTTLEDDVPQKIIATPYFIIYSMMYRLMIYEHGKTKQLSRKVDNFYASDSIVVWQESNSLNILAYMNGEISTLESGFPIMAIRNSKIGKNLFAYTDMNNQFKIFYNNKIYETQSYYVSQYQCGLNTVLFVDNSSNTLNIFYKGSIHTLYEQVPKSFMAGDNMACYVDANENFMFFYDGAIRKLETYSPPYFMKDNILSYNAEPELKVVYKGQKYSVDKFVSNQTIPGAIGANSFLYSDVANRPKYFYNGKVFQNFIFETITEMHLNYDLPVFKFGNNTIAFYYEGKIYDYETTK